MSFLPENKQQEVDRTPHNFFIYGKPMSGKSYLAQYFPNPVFINTDGNSRMNAAPSVQIRNTFKSDGKTIDSTIIDQLKEMLAELRVNNQKFETVVIDVVDDLIAMIEQAICLIHNVSSLSDIPYGKGYALLNGELNNLVISLKMLPLNVIYISREIMVSEDINSDPQPRPSLKDKYYNVVTGNCDLVIRCMKVGSNYTRMATERRTAFKQDDVRNERIKQILSKVYNVFD